MSAMPGIASTLSMRAVKGRIELRDLLSRELDEANLVLDEWDFARTRDKQSDTIAPCERAGESRD